MTPIKERLLEVVTRVFPAFRSTSSWEQQRVQDIPNFDSMNYVLLIASLEREFKIKFGPKDLGQIKDFQFLIGVIEAKCLRK